MPDITMCNGEDCPLKKKCYRYMALPEKLQPYFCESPIEGDKCSSFMPFNSKDKIDESKNS